MSYVYKFDLASTVESKRIFQAAIETDPSFALGYAGVARSIVNIRHVHNQPISEGELTQALEFANRAVELSPEDEVVLTCAAYVVSLLGGKPERGHELAKRATALNVNSAQAWNARGTVELVLGESEAALAAFANVMRLNPLDTRSVPFALFGTAAALLQLGRYKDGAAAARRMLLTGWNDTRGLFILIGNVFLDGDMEETGRLIHDFKRLFPHVRSADLRQTYQVGKRETRATTERIIARIALPECPASRRSSPPATKTADWVEETHAKSVHGPTLPSVQSAACPELRVDRKRPAEGQTDAIDPTPDLGGGAA